MATILSARCLIIAGACLGLGGVFLNILSQINTALANLPL